MTATLAATGMAAATNAADCRVVAAIDAEIARLNASGEVWSANSLRGRLPSCSPGLVGARVKAATMRRPVEMVRVGIVRSNLPSTKGKWICTYRGVS